MLSLNTKEGAEELLNALHQRNHSKQGEEEQAAELVLKTTPLPKVWYIIINTFLLKILETNVNPLHCHPFRANKHDNIIPVYLLYG